jgi:nucleoid-associated protein YgaU
MADDPDAKVVAEDIRRDMRNLEGLLQRALKQLALADQYGLPDSTPYFSFRSAASMEEFLAQARAGKNSGLRPQLRSDIALARLKLREMKRQADRLAAGERATLVKREYEALLTADRNGDRRAQAIIDRAAGVRGGLTAAEFAQVQALMLGSLKAHTAFMKAHPSRKAVTGTLDRLSGVQALGLGDTDIATGAIKGVQSAQRRIVDQTRAQFLKKPTPNGAKVLIDEIAVNDLLGGESAMNYVNRDIVPNLAKIMLDAERRFRNTPTKDNCEAMINAEMACVNAGGAGLPDPPKGLRRIKQGTTRRFGPGDMLSAVSKEYYGSFGYWDVIYKANWAAFHDPDRPTPNTTIDIPY